MKKRYLRMPAEFGDGANCFVHRIDDERSAIVAAEMLQVWMLESDVDDVVSLSIVELTDDEFERLPEQEHPRAAAAEERVMKKRYLRMPAEFGDGANCFVHRIDDERSAIVAAEMLQVWMLESDVDDVVSLSIVELTDDEFERLPEQEHPRAAAAEERVMKKRYLRMPAEFGDGANCFVHRIDDERSAIVAAEMLQVWMLESDVDDVVSLSIVELTDDEFERLPEQ